MTERNAMMIKHLVLDETILQKETTEEEEEPTKEWTLEEVLEASATAIPGEQEDEEW
jgi:hypothetical protein